jgi:hypothetical protein
LYTEERLWIDLIRATPYYDTNQMEYDTWGSECGTPQVDVPFDHHLGEIAIPIFYIGASEGTNGEYTTTLTKSKDVTNLVLGPPDNPGFGHADLFLARNAETLVWQPILEWLKAHR